MHVSVETVSVCTLRVCVVEEPERNRELATGPDGRTKFFSAFGGYRDQTQIGQAAFAQK